MAVVPGALGSLVPKVLQLLEDEYKLKKGVRKRVSSLAEELNSMQVALSKVAQVPYDRLDEEVKLWASEVREASYDMEDAIDTFLVRVDGGGHPADDQANVRRLRKKMSKMSSLNKIKARHGIARAIEDIKEQINEMDKRRERYKIDGTVGKPVALTYVDPRLASMYTKVTELIGTGKALGDIISMLEIKKRVSIVGIGGSGKTSLAKASYEKLSFKYDCKAFVSVGQSPNLAKLFMDILYALDKWKYENIHITGRGVHFLVGELRKFLENKRYLMVMDDLWDTSTWNMIATALVMDSNCDYRVLITTRIVDIAKEAGDVYHMDPLPEVYSKELFCTRMGIDPMNDQLSSKEVEKILKKCGGIPLCIIVIASLLADKPMTDWNEVYNSIGFGHQYLSFNMWQILSFIYWDLPPHLRTCLLYLRIYPEYKEINKEELIWRWIGEGFINREDGKELFQVAEIYFSQLINKSMIQPVYSDYDGLVYSCRVHDLVLDFICMLATETNFVRDLGSVGVEHRSSSNACLRRLTLHGETNQSQKSNLKATDMVCVRSINAFSCPIMRMMPPLSSFKVLRVLSLESCEQGCDLKHLGKLLHLRHLGLRGTPVHEIPREIGSLVCLQSLDVMYTGLKELPSTVGELGNLMRLRLDFGIEVSPWLGKLTSLQALWCVSEQSSTVVELGKLTELRILRIVFQKLEEGDVKALEQSLHHLRKIEELCICCDDGPVLSSLGSLDWEPPRQIRVLGLPEMPLPRLSLWLNPKHLLLLYYLHLELKDFEAQDMEILGSLPELRELRLFLHMGRIVSWTFTGGKLFPNLKTMWLKDIDVKNVHLLELKNVNVTLDNGRYSEQEDDDPDDEEETLARDQERQKYEVDILVAGDGVAKLSLGSN